jgi:pimeloyl-ACP methyl ester carboxylesterase
VKQDIRFCASADGVRIAYATSGESMPIVRPGHWLTHLEYDLNSPIWGHLIQGLSEQHQLVRYDPRGTGLSERNVEEVGPKLWLKDLEAVVDNLRLERFALLGISQGGATAIRYAVVHPDRVSHLILYGCYARGRLHRRGADGYNSPEMLAAMCTLMLEGWGSNNESYRELFASAYVPSGNREHIHFLNELEKVSATPEMAVKYLRAMADIDVRALLPQVKVSTLVLHCRGDRAVPCDLGRELASGIAGAKFVPMEGENHLFLEDEPAREIFFEEVARFLGDKRKLVTRSALARHARGFRAATHSLHHIIEPYYMLFFVASVVVGAVTFILSRTL